MFSFLSPRKITVEIPKRLYGTVMAKARDPLLFTRFGVPDTVMGRFDMLALHVYLFSRRMKREGGELALALSQDVFDCFTEDLERALRQLGIGDQTVPKRKKKMIRSFYDQIEDFDKAFENGDHAQLTANAARRYLDREKPAPGAANLADYMLEADVHLAEQPFDQILKGELTWPSIPGGGI